MKPVVIVKHKINVLQKELENLQQLQLDSQIENSLKIQHIQDKINHYQSILTELEETVEE